jgi:raffinose/stachyose/melibiose transport system substrate-binding protein
MLADSKYATLTYQPGYVPGVVTTEDWARAVTKLGYRPSKDQGFIDTMAALKAWSQYWAPGWASDQSADTKALQLFQSGKLAFMWEGSWVVPQLKGFNLPFKYGSFWFPPVTSATSKQVTAPTVPFGVGGYGAHNYMVTYKDSLDPTKMAAIVDYLQYITTPQHDATIVNESPQFIPSVVGAKGDPAIAALFGAFAGQAKYAGQTPSTPYGCMWIPDGQDQFNRAVVSYQQGAESQASLLALADSLDVSGAQKFIAANDMSKVKGGTWDLTKW